MKLHGYWRSGTTHRVRLALGFKGIAVETVSVDLRKNEQRDPAYTALNPSAGVPMLVLDDGSLLTQSGAIIEYLEERFPEPPLLPASAKLRARVRQLCDMIGCDIHPLQNLRVQNYLKDVLDQPQSELDAWLQRWMGDGLGAIEAELARDNERGTFCVGGHFTMAECYLLPQLYAARRFGISLDALPLICAVEARAAQISFVAHAAPEAQPDAG